MWLHCWNGVASTWFPFGPRQGRYICQHAVFCLTNQKETRPQSGEKAIYQKAPCLLLLSNNAPILHKKNKDRAQIATFEIQSACELNVVPALRKGVRFGLNASEAPWGRQVNTHAKWCEFGAEIQHFLTSSSIWNAMLACFFYPCSVLSSETHSRQNKANQRNQALKS